MKYLFLLSVFLFPLVTGAEMILVEVDSGLETVNAVEGTIVLREGASVENIYTGNSVIPIWVVTPTYDEDTNSIYFSGIVPGGFKGEYPLFLLEGSLRQSGITFRNVIGLRNDGLGTSVPVRLTLSNASSDMATDSDPPEIFKPIVSHSQDLFENKYFVSFLTQDKGSGIDRYEYATTWLLGPRESSWVSASSPLELSFTQLFKRVHVRAVDKMDNERVARVGGPYRLYLYVLGVIIILWGAYLYRKHHLAHL